MDENSKANHTCFSNTPYQKVITTIKIHTGSKCKTDHMAILRYFGWGPVCLIGIEQADGLSYINHIPNKQVIRQKKTKFWHSTKYFRFWFEFQYFRSHSEVKILKYLWKIWAIVQNLTSRLPIDSITCIKVRSHLPLFSDFFILF